MKFYAVAILFLIILVPYAGAVVLINEVDADQVGTDATEFVELYNTDGTPVDLGAGGYVLVLYNGSDDLSYNAYDLTGTIGGNDYFVIGTGTVTNVDLTPTGWPATNAIQNGADAVALYSGTTAVLFPNDTPMTTSGLIDAVVYGTSDADDTGLLTGLTPGQPQVDEGTSGTTSIQRSPDGGGGALVTTEYIADIPTPGTANPAPAVVATLIGAGALGGSVVALFDIDPGAVTELDFALTGSQSLSFTGIAGGGTQRVLTPSAALVGDSAVDNLAVAATVGTNAGDVDFYIYPAISDIQNGPIPDGAQVSVAGTVTGVRTGTAEGSGQEYSIADAAGAWNGIMIEDSVNTPAIGDNVEVAGVVDEQFGCTEIEVTGYLNLGAGTPIAPTVITAVDFQHTAPQDALPNEQYEGVLIQIDALRNAQDNSFGETIFDDNVATDGLFYDARGQGDIVDGSDYDVVGIGYFSFGDWKMLPRGSSDLTEIGDTSPPGIQLAFATGIGVDEVSILFNEAVDQTTAETAGNYELFASPSTSLGNPTSATLVTSGAPVNRGVALTFTAGTIVDKSVYFVRVSNVEDTKGNAITTPVDSNNLYGGVQPISWAGAETNDVTDRDSNICVTVTGTVTSVNDFGSGEIYVQDDTGGIQDRDFEVDYTIDVLERGDRILVAGFVGQYNGKPQIDDDTATGNWDPVTVELGDETGSVAPRIISVSQLGEDTENELVVIFGVTIDPGSDINFAATTGYGISDSSGSGILWVDPQTDLVGEPIPTGPITLRGIGTQFNGGSPNTGYEIGPRTTDDLDPEFTEAETSVEMWEIYR